jgi:polyvinyl alcohol dehydrogenase (cytochrome)
MKPIIFRVRWNTWLVTGLLTASCLGFAADPDGAAIYKQRCAACHDVSGETRAPLPTALRLMSPENILRSLESGQMKEQGAQLRASEKRIVAEFLTGKTIGQQSQPAKANLCADPKAAFSPSGANWNGWGADLANTRFQGAAAAGLTAAQTPRLKLKWAFAYPNTFVANGQPTVVGGRIFVPSANRNIYSLDAQSGCQYWSFEAQAPVRTAISIATLKGERTRHIAFFGDRRANMYAVDASSGELLWKVHVDDHSHAAIVGAPQYYDGRLLVPVTAAEEGPSMSAKYECCSARGALVMLDALTGKQIWKTYTIAEEPHPTGKNAEGAQKWGPSGASIWSAPTIDVERKVIYAGTGDNFSDPATKGSDAVIAFDMQTGKILWMKQLTEGDVFNMACEDGPSKANCPEKVGPDVDIGASPILVKLANGKRVLLVSQKSGVAHGLDPDKNGEILWQTRVGHGGALGGIQWGSASDGKNMYVALSDINLLQKQFGTGKKLVADPKAGGGLFALNAATGAKVWTAAPPSCGDRPSCSPAQSAAVSAIPGVVFSGSVDGHLRGYSMTDGKAIWDFDTTREFTTVNGLTTKGGSLDGPGPTIAGGMLYVNSGYGSWGGLPGNVLLAFSVDGK